MIVKSFLTAISFLACLPATAFCQYPQGQCVPFQTPTSGFQRPVVVVETPTRMVLPAQQYQEVPNCSSPYCCPIPIQPCAAPQLTTPTVSPDGFPGVTAATPFGVDPNDAAPLTQRPVLVQQRMTVSSSNDDRLRRLLKAILTGEHVGGAPLPNLGQGLGLDEEQADEVIQAYLNEEE